ncbi:MAG: DUF357 domain-containing protein [Nanoarchaeota archaeon]|nr:DUF357 domain-containing protein [Nanoarchaeota archaeon]
MKDKITNKKLEKYFELTSKGLNAVKKAIVSGREKDAKEITEMVENYLSDARHFFNNDDFVNAFAALNYAHGWLDCGVRLGVFDVSDDKLFTVR